jgi:hypothetical protein
MMSKSVIAAVQVAVDTPAIHPAALVWHALASHWI